MPDHELVITWDGEDEYVHVVCNLTGADRPCAVIECPKDHDDVTQACIEEHGAAAIDKCWAVEWEEYGGRETLDVHLPPTHIPVTIAYDEGVLVREVPPTVEERVWRPTLSYDDVGFAISALNGMLLPLDLNPTRDRVVRGLIRLHDALADAEEQEGGK